VYTYPYSVRNY